MDSHTKKSTRIIIWVIAVVMTVGFIGSYFVIIVQNENAKNEQNNTQTQLNDAAKEQQVTDPTAFKVEGRIAELQKIDLKEGTGEEVKLADLVRMHYKGTLAQTGSKFDSSYDNGEPLTCTLTSLIPGWQEGVPGMKVGGKRRLLIPANLGYGAQGTTGIPPDSDLVFEIELVAINPPGGVDQCAR